LNLGWNRFRNCLKGLNKVFRTLIVFCLFTVVSLAETQINPLGKQTGTTYDPAGNRLRTNAQATDNTVASGNRITAAAVNTYAYDDYGNMVQKSRIQDPSDKWIYSYDHRNRLTLAIHYSGVSVLTTVSYTYDALNRRMAKTGTLAGSSSQSRYYFYAGEQLLAEKTPDGGVIHYLSGSGLDNWLARQRPGQGTEWFLKDRLGSVKALTNGSGQMIEAFDYSVFGVPNNPSTTIGFTGREFDQETGLYYYRARYYEPSLGKFLSSDPLGFDAGDYNLSRYVMNDPLGYVDPTGMVVLVDYGKLQEKISAAGAECAKAIGITLATDKFIEIGIYLFLGNSAVYVGQTLDNFDVRENAHIRRLEKEGIEIVKDTFKPLFRVAKGTTKAQLDQLEEFLIQSLKRDLGDLAGVKGKKPGQILNRRHQINTKRPGVKFDCGALVP